MPIATPMALQAVQQREFEGDKQILFNSVVDVLQDLGFNIEVASLETGLITALSPLRPVNTGFNDFLFAGATGSTRMTVFVEALANGRVRVRLSCISRWSYPRSYVNRRQYEEPITDQRFYQVAFEKIEEALFTRRAISSPVRE